MSQSSSSSQARFRKCAPGVASEHIDRPKPLSVHADTTSSTTASRTRKLAWIHVCNSPLWPATPLRRRPH
eukprot:8668527-Alexandrium_andersonii.AAC.1